MAAQETSTHPSPVGLEDASIVLAARDDVMTSKYGFKYRVGSNMMMPGASRISGTRVAVAALRQRGRDDKDLEDLVQLCWDGTAEEIQKLYRNNAGFVPREGVMRFPVIKAALSRYFAQRSVVSEPPSAPKRKADPTTVEEGREAVVPYPKRQKAPQRPTPSAQETADGEKGTAVAAGPLFAASPRSGDGQEASLVAERQKLTDKWLTTFGARSLISTWSGTPYRESSLREQMAIDKVLRVHREWIRQECYALSLAKNIDELRRSLLGAVSSLQEALV